MNCTPARRAQRSCPGRCKIPPGGLVLFDGDTLRHRISPSREGETRISLTFEYVTDPRMHPWWRLISNMKDAFAYFGFRQVFHRFLGRGQVTRTASWLLSIGVLLFVGVLLSQDLPAILATLAARRLGAAAGGAVSPAAAGHRCRWQFACCSSGTQAAVRCATPCWRAGSANPPTV